LWLNPLVSAQGKSILISVSAKNLVEATAISHITCDRLKSIKIRRNDKMRIYRMDSKPDLLSAEQIYALLTWKSMRDYSKHLRDRLGYDKGINPSGIDVSLLKRAIKDTEEGARDVRLFQKKGLKLSGEARRLMYHMGIADQSALDLVHYEDGQDVIHYASLDKVLGSARWLVRKCRRLEDRAKALYERQQSTGKDYMLAREMYRGTCCRA